MILPFSSSGTDSLSVNSRTTYTVNCWTLCFSSNTNTISPDTWNLDQSVLDRLGNEEIQLTLFYDYRNNVKQYAEWQEYFRTYQPPTLVAWGENDMFFGPKGALAFQNDLKDCEVHLLNTGHFPLEEDLEISASLIKHFLGERLK